MVMLYVPRVAHTCRDSELEHAFLARAEQRHGTMRGNLVEGFGELEVVAILGAFVFLAWHDGGDDLRLLPEILTQLAQQFGVLAELLDQDVSGAIEHRLD